MNKALKSAASKTFGRHIPGTKEIQDAIRVLGKNSMGKEMLIKELQTLWLIMDNAVSQEVCLKYRNMYADSLRQLGATTPRAATVSARPITREEFNAVTGTEEDI